jgi:hypothetical protein
MRLIIYLNETKMSSRECLRYSDEMKIAKRNKSRDGKNNKHDLLGMISTGFNMTFASFYNLISSEG